MLVICGEEQELQIPPLRYAPVGMTKGALVVGLLICGGKTGTTDPSTALRSGRDDKGCVGCGPADLRWGNGMTNLRAFTFPTLLLA
jgi:hypothetical protein